MFIGVMLCYADKGCLPDIKENREDKVEPTLNKRDLRFLYGWVHEKIFGQNGMYSKDLFIPYTLGDGSFFKALYCSVLVLIKNLSFYDSLEIEN